jgi:kynureninase
MSTHSFQNTIEFALSLDKTDALAKFRDEFYIPNFHTKQVRYFTGNSLGLQPKKAEKYLLEELEAWRKFGVEGHFEAKRPWFSYHEFLTPLTAKIVGAKEIEVVVTHSLTTNLHLLMASFYNPKGNRTKILCEAKAFPSDQYALESQVKFHDLDPQAEIIEIAPRLGEHLINEEDIYAKIAELGETLAMVMIGGVNYYSGQLFDMAGITKSAHAVGAYVGFDLAHAVGNIDVKLHDWGCDFAAWCGYKYLNSSPGGVSGLFVHERHAHNKDLKRLAGWWGHNKDTRFKMTAGFDPLPGAESWQLSNAPVLGMAVHLASLELFEEATMFALCEKRDVLTAYLEFIVDEVEKELGTKEFQIITPRDISKRGCQLSILLLNSGKEVFQSLCDEGIVADWREPNVIRLAPVPMYNTFEDVFVFGQALKMAFNK